MDPRLALAPAVGALAERLSGSAEPDFVIGLYVGGSLASGDYHPGTSDLDVVALTASRPDRGQRKRLAAVHGLLGRADPSAAALHCAYLPLDNLDDVSVAHPTWAFDELFDRPVSGIARAELLADPVVVLGPSPRAWLPAMDVDDVREAARSELAGYWTKALRRRRIWLQDVYVDLGLFTLARAEATLTDGRLITKQEAIGRLASLGVDPALVEEIARRRNGGATELTEAERRVRAEHVRPLLADSIRRLLAQH